MKRAAIYTRVSTTDQHPEMQEEELVRYVIGRNWALHKKYSDKGVSGACEKRPGLDALLDDCRRRKVDVVVVWKFDRFARSLKQLVNALDLFRQLNIARGRTELLRWREMLGPEFSPFVFPNMRAPARPRNDIRHGWAKALQDAGLDYFWTYNLRHTSPVA